MYLNVAMTVCLCLNVTVIALASIVCDRVCTVGRTVGRTLLCGRVLDRGALSVLRQWVAHCAAETVCLNTLCCDCLHEYAVTWLCASMHCAMTALCNQQGLPRSQMPLDAL
jgi:hypothetical protein